MLTAHKLSTLSAALVWRTLTAISSMQAMPPVNRDTMALNIPGYAPSGAVKNGQMKVKATSAFWIITIAIAVNPAEQFGSSIINLAITTAL